MKRKLLKALALPVACLGAAVGAALLAKKALVKDRDIKVKDAAMQESIPEAEACPTQEAEECTIQNTEEES